MIHVFHGFLGSTEDFSFLRGKDIIFYDLYDMGTYPEISPEDILIGYSMGGRIALEIAHRCHYQLKKIVLLNAHPGLGTDQEKIDRMGLEKKIMKSLKEYSKDEFFSWWNSLDIFKTDRPITTSDDKFLKSASLFEKYCLSKQINYLPEIIKYREKVLYIVGFSDDKYREMANNLLLPHHIKVRVMAAGHRLHQNQNELLNILIDEGII